MQRLRSSTVMQALEEFLSVREPEVVMIVSKSEQLTRIYETYLKREAGRLERMGYILETTSRTDPFTEFILRRTRRSQWRR
jgi:hypothetical protein